MIVKRFRLIVAGSAVALMAAGCVTGSAAHAPKPPPPALVEAGGSHSCAIDQHRQIACWGSNAQGQLGIGSFVNSTAPHYVLGMSNATAVTASLQHSCAINAGSVYCWGSNAKGQLGDGTLVNRPSPVHVDGLANVTQIATGIGHSCALDVSGVVRCWGDNSSGQLGDGTTVSSPTPVEVTGLSNVKSISVRGLISCALTTSGAIRCWGDNSQGQLGNGTTTNSPVPVAPSGIATASQISPGGLHTCARTGGSVSCWGNNSQGQLGNGTTTGSLLPVAVPGLSDVTDLVLGGLDSCAIVTGGGAKCWGFNSKGQLGNGTTTNSSTPVPVTGLEDLTHISLGLTHTCAVLGGSAIVCWGDNGSGQIGNTTIGASSLSPVPVDTPTAPPPVVPPDNVNTVSDYDLDCQATLNGNPVDARTIAATTTVSHPLQVHSGETFHVIVSDADIDVPLTYPPGVTLQNMSNFASRISLPTTATLLSASYTPGVNLGAGVPSLTNAGTYEELDVPGPFTPGTTVTLPSIDLELQATGASGQTIDFIRPGTRYADRSYTFLVNLVSVGLVRESCFVDPSPILGSVTII